MSSSTLAHYYRFHARIYDETRFLFLFGRASLLEELDEGGPPERILEVGCGTGSNLLRLARRFPDAKLVGMDLSPDMLARARRKLRPYGARVELVETRYPTAKGREARFDLILFSYALTMFGPDFRGAVSAAKESLSREGRIAVVDFDDSTLPGFKPWMSFNHVRIDGSMLPWLRETFPTSRARVRRAFAGAWTYFTFVGRR